VFQGLNYSPRAHLMISWRLRDQHQYLFQNAVEPTRPACLFCPLPAFTSSDTRPHLRFIAERSQQSRGHAQLRFQLCSSFSFCVTVGQKVCKTSRSDGIQLHSNNSFSLDGRLRIPQTRQHPEASSSAGCEVELLYICQLFSFRTFYICLMWKLHSASWLQPTFGVIYLSG